MVSYLTSHWDAARRGPDRLGEIVGRVPGLPDCVVGGRECFFKIGGTL